MTGDNKNYNSLLGTIDSQLNDITRQIDDNNHFPSKVKMNLTHR